MCGNEHLQQSVHYLFLFLLIQDPLAVTRPTTEPPLAVTSPTTEPAKSSSINRDVSTTIARGTIYLCYLFGRDGTILYSYSVLVQILPSSTHTRYSLKSQILVSTWSAYNLLHFDLVLTLHSYKTLL